MIDGLRSLVTLVQTAIGTIGPGQFTLAPATGPCDRVAITPGSFDDRVGVDNIRFNTAAVTAVPEPASMALVLLGPAGAGLALRRQR